jgi:hypothetical protein
MPIRLTLEKLTCRMIFFLAPAGNELAISLRGEGTTFPYLLLTMDRSEKEALTRVSRPGGDHGWPVSPVDTKPLNRPLR